MRRVNHIRFYCPHLHRQTTLPPRRRSCFLSQLSVCQQGYTESSEAILLRFGGLGWSMG